VKIKSHNTLSSGLSEQIRLQLSFEIIAANV